MSMALITNNFTPFGTSFAMNMNSLSGRVIPGKASFPTGSDWVAEEYLSMRLAELPVPLLRNAVCSQLGRGRN